MKLISGNLAASTPVYVTRKTANGWTGSLSMSIWMQILVMVLVWLNAIVWGGIGLYEAVRVVVG